MNVTTSAFSPTQMILAWTLLGLLLTWLITFTVLALRVFVSNKNKEWNDLPTPARSSPAISTQSSETQLQYAGTTVGNISSKGTTIESSYPSRGGQG